MINGQVAVMWLLSALFLLPQNGGNRKCQTCLVRSLSAGQFSGDWGDAHQQAESFLYKRTLLASIIPSSREPEGYST